MAEPAIRYSRMMLCPPELSLSMVAMIQDRGQSSPVPMACFTEGPSQPVDWPGEGLIGIAVYGPAPILLLFTCVQDRTPKFKLPRIIQCQVTPIHQGLALPGAFFGVAVCVAEVRAAAPMPNAERIDPPYPLKKDLIMALNCERPVVFLVPERYIVTTQQAL